MMAIAVCRGGATKGFVEIRGPVRLGRSPACEVRIAEGWVSRVHAELIPRGHGCILIDRGSTNGTYLEGQPLQPGVGVYLPVGSAFMIGDFMLHLTVGDANATARLPDPRVAAPVATAGHGTCEVDITPLGPVLYAIVGLLRQASGAVAVRLVCMSSQGIDYRPGQYVLLERSAPGSNHREACWITSTPTRPKTLEVSIDAESATGMAHWLRWEAQTGMAVYLSGPYGLGAAFPRRSRSHLVLSYDRWVSPAISLYRWIEDSSEALNVCGLHFETVERAQAPEELRLLARGVTNGRFASIVVPQSWLDVFTGGLLGRAELQWIAELFPDFADRTTYLSAPPDRRRALEKNLWSAGLSRGQILVFTGPRDVMIQSQLA